MESDSFSDCISLTSIELPKRLETIGPACFSNCGLETIVIPESVKEIHRGSFGDCKYLKNVHLPEGITELSAFMGCTAIESIVLPKSLKIIDGFEGCKNLKQIELPEGLTRIEMDAFRFALL